MNRLPTLKEICISEIENLDELGWQDIKRWGKGAALGAAMAGGIAGATPGAAQAREPTTQQQGIEGELPFKSLTGAKDAFTEKDLNKIRQELSSRGETLKQIPLKLQGYEAYVSENWNVIKAASSSKSAFKSSYLVVSNKRTPENRFIGVVPNVSPEQAFDYGKWNTLLRGRNLESGHIKLRDSTRKTQQAPADSTGTGWNLESGHIGIEFVVK